MKSFLTLKKGKVVVSQGDRKCSGPMLPPPKSIVFGAQNFVKKTPN